MMYFLKLRSTLLPLILLAFATRGITAADPVKRRDVSNELVRPNILYFYVDDMGWGSIGPNAQWERKANGMAFVQTPNLDQLARQGVNFVRGYGCHVCSPARSSQQSGFHQGHTFADRNDPNNAKKAMRADDQLMGDVLSEAGYVTGYWGKWGYGGSKDQAAPVIENVQTLPTSHGYQHVLAELHHVRAHTFFQPTLWSAPTKKGSRGGLELVANTMARYQDNADYPKTPALQNHPKYPTTAYCDDSYAMAALDFVRQQGDHFNHTGQPFFGLLAVQIPHAPFGEIASLPDWDKAYADDPKFSSLADQTRQWAAMVTRIDAHFGNILDALDDPNQDGDTSDSIADNTLVVFQSDNGGPGGKNNVELNANGGLRGTKGSIYEGGIRVPLVMRWPAMIRSDSSLIAGTNSSTVVDVTDLLPTFCELADAPIPLAVDGVSIAPTLTGVGKQRQREFIIHEAGNGQSIIRGDFKLIRTRKSKAQLFDLGTDPSESNDIATAHPEMVKHLEQLLLGERVDEPRGFATTYHRWTGRDQATTSRADNWSDYRYENAGVTYMTDEGAPQLSWIARIENSGQIASVAKADADLEFLGLEIRGSGKAATQELMLGPQIGLTGRNEIRLAQHSKLTMDDGTVSTLRSITIDSSAALTGSGSVVGDVANDGSVLVQGDSTARLAIEGDLLQSDVAILGVQLSDQSTPSVTVSGHADLAGALEVTVPNGVKLNPGLKMTILTASTVSGEFSNPGAEVIDSDGRRYAIQYGDSAVTLLAK